MALNKLLRCLYLIFILSLNCFFAQDKHALVVAIGDYPAFENSDLNWSDLSSLNDVELLRELLMKQEFAFKNTTLLLNEKANATRLHKVFDSLTNTLKAGDVFFFHFSGHGQQVADFKPSDFPSVKFLKRDEADGLDEALVLYNAPLRAYDGYNYAEHFYDDQLNYYLTKIQDKIGPTGQVIVVIDACHSGTATRGAEDIIVRGSKISMIPEGYKIEENSNDNSLGFDADLNFKSEGSLAPMVAFFGCKAEQVNREIRDRNGKGYGSLTYFFTKSFYELKDQASFQNLFSKINEKMILQFRSEQNPVFEGTNLNSKIFNGDLIIQEPFFDLIKLLPQIATINGGQLNGLQVGDSIGFYPNTTTDIKNIKPLFKGVITNLGIQESIVQLLTIFTGRNDEYVKYRAFNINPVNQSNLIVLKINMQSKSLKKDAQKFFDDQKDVELVETNFNYLIVDTLIHGQSFIRVYIGNNQTNALRGMPFRKIVSASSWDSLLTDIRQSVRTDVFRKLALENENVNIDVKLLNKHKTVMDSGNIAIKDGDMFYIELVNNNDFPVYFNLIDIYPDNRLNLDPKLKNKIIYPNKKITFENYVGEPYGMEQFKLIFTDQPIDLSSLEKNGAALTRGGGTNPLLEFVDAQATGTRGRKESELSNVTVKSILFEIQKP